MLETFGTRGEDFFRLFSPPPLPPFPPPPLSEIIRTALDTGIYKFLDCAEFYNNEASVGLGIRLSSVPRSSLFLASKVWTSTMEAGRPAVRAQVLKTLADLGTDYLDLYCVHWPTPGGVHVSAYRELEKMKEEGFIRHLGISNYGIEDYKELMDEGCR